MKIIVNGRHLEITEPIRKYAEEKIARVEKYFDQITEINVTLSVEKSKSEGELHKADVLLFGSGLKLKIDVEDKDLYAAIDKVTDIAERKVRQHKEKLKDHNKKGTH